jgi:hypothetical protein
MPLFPPQRLVFSLVFSLVFYYFFVFSFFFALPIAQAQRPLPPYQVFCVELTDKDNTPYTLLRPQDFLTARAIARRSNQGLEFEDTDLPITPAYLAEIERAGGIVTNRSKWLNAVAVFAPDTATQEKIKLMPFVRRIYPLGFRRLPQPPKDLRRIIRDSSGKKPDYYGFGANQAYMLDAPRLHAGGYDGSGVHIAIFDGGFENVYRMPAFDSLYANGQILGTHDFVEGDDFVFEDSGHGTDVLSCMASNMPYLLVGTAPKASFYLFKTEDTKGEFWIEEFNWVAAAEYADSVGVDIINSSLGYTMFKDTIMDYDYARDLDGKTTIAARGADIAVLKGMVVFNSAGNEGNKKWHYIGTPADAENVISVAATRSDGSKAAFSSVGPTADGRIKPNLAAQGQDAFVASIFGYAVKTTSGTSFSSPILTGAVACLRQSCLDMPSLDFKRLLESYASQAKTPDSLLGYGIPNLLITYLSMKKTAFIVVTDQGGLQNGKLAGQEIEIWTTVAPMVADNIEINLYNQLSQLVYTKRENYTETRSDMRVYRIPTADIPKGAYLLILNIGGRKLSFTVCK